jgi:hypothetical protein
MNKKCGEVRKDVNLIEEENKELELGEVRINKYIEKIIEDEKWIGDEKGIVKKCMDVIKN